MKKVVIGDCTLIHGNCLEMLATVLPGSVSCCFADPPFGVRPMYVA